jgi:aconitate hydratase
MGAELGATTSLFPYDERMALYLKSTGREALAELADQKRALLQADPEVEKDPGGYFDEIVEIDLSKLEPHIVGPHTPDLARPVSRMAADVRENGYAPNLSSVLIGSCTNSSYEDFSRAADVARQAGNHGAKVKTKLFCTPGSEQVYQTVQRDGQLEALEAIGAVVLANACGPCIGQWKRDDVKKGEPNSILTSFNRNFPKRNDGNPETLAHREPRDRRRLRPGGFPEFQSDHRRAREREGRVLQAGAARCCSGGTRAGLRHRP